MTTTTVPTCTDDLLAEIEAAAKAATKGEWKVKDGHYPSFKDLDGPSFKLSVVVSATDLGLSDYMARTSDLEHIALCNHATILALVARVRELERDAARLDWLADPFNQIGAVQLPTECVTQNLHSLRAAIDAAMQGSSQ